MKTAYEVNYDGLVGSTHNYAGLALGNIASEKNALLTSNPRAAVQQGLNKMLFLHELGCPQAIIPPQARPNCRWLASLGYRGEPASMIEQAYRDDPRLVAIAYSASSMWTANAATVSPSADTEDGRVHITAANLMSQAHRFHESPVTYQILKQLFPDPRYFTHHLPLPASALTSDEGAANHTRLSLQYGEPGVEIFVYGRSGFSETLSSESRRYPARQSKIASESIARLHRLDPKRTLFLTQNPLAIDAGVFHNDVIAVGNLGMYFYHESAYQNPKILTEFLTRFGFQGIQVSSDEISLDEAVKSYLFNSQLVVSKTGETLLIAPQESYESRSVKQYLDSQTFAKVHYVECRQSMRNGGGPACLRLRVVLTEEELSAVHQPAIFTKALYRTLMNWSERYYRTELKPADLRDPLLIEENRASLVALSEILKVEILA